MANAVLPVAAHPTTVIWSGDISDTIVADQNDYAPSGIATATVVRIDGGAADRNITGLAGGADGRIVVIANVGTTNVLNLVDESGSSAAANRFAVRPSPNLIIAVDAVAMLIYDATSTRWRALGNF